MLGRETALPGKTISIIAFEVIQPNTKTALGRFSWNCVVFYIVITGTATVLHKMLVKSFKSQEMSSDTFVTHFQFETVLILYR